MPRPRERYAAQRDAELANRDQPRAGEAEEHFVERPPVANRDDSLSLPALPVEWLVLLRRPTGRGKSSSATHPNASTLRFYRPGAMALHVTRGVK